MTGLVWAQAVALIWATAMKPDADFGLAVGPLGAGVSHENSKVLGFLDEKGYADLLVFVDFTLLAFVEAGIVDARSLERVQVWLG